MCVFCLIAFWFANLQTTSYNNLPAQHSETKQVSLIPMMSSGNISSLEIPLASLNEIPAQGGPEAPPILETSSGVVENHGSAAGTSVTADAGSLGNPRMEYPQANTSGPTMAFLSGPSSAAATPAPGRIHIGATPPPAETPQRGRRRVKDRGAAASEPHSRSRSSHSRTRLPPGARRPFEAPGGHVEDMIKKLETIIKDMEARSLQDRQKLAQLSAVVGADRAASGLVHKWASDNAKRVDAIESQVRDQTNQAMEYARSKCTEVDAKLRAEIAAGVPGLEAKLATPFGTMEARIKALEAMNVTDRIMSLEAKMAVYSTSAAKTLEAPGLKERIDGFDQTLKAHVSITEQHRAYLSAQFSAKPGEEQTLLAHFRRLEAEILKLGAAPLNPMAAGEVKSMLQDFETHMANKHGDAVTKQMGDSGNMLSMAVAAMTAQHDKANERLMNIEEHLKAVDTEIMLVKTAFSSVPSRSAIRTPPSELRQDTPTST